MLQAAAAARSERQDLEQEQQKQQKLEQQKQKRLEQLKGSTPEAMQIMREAMGDSAGQFMIASHGQVLPSFKRRPNSARKSEYERGAHGLFQQL